MRSTSVTLRSPRGPSGSWGCMTGAALFLVLAWRVAGYYGLDAYQPPLPGTRWTDKPAGKSDAEIAESTSRRHAAVA